MAARRGTRMVWSGSRTAVCPAQDARPFQQALHVASWLEMPCDRMLAVFGCFWGHNFSAMAHSMEFMYQRAEMVLNRVRYRNKFRITTSVRVGSITGPRKLTSGLWLFSTEGGGARKRAPQ